MGILIKGMEMPTEHRTEVIIFSNGFVAYYDVYGHYLGQARATQLPEKHGKIIDGDALWENMTAEQADAFRKGLAGDIELFEILEAAHAIIEAEGDVEDG